MVFETDITYRLDQLIRIDKGTTIFLLVFSLQVFKDFWVDPKKDLASIDKFSVILTPVTIVVHGPPPSLDTKKRKPMLFLLSTKF
jgi:hypothetical protein